jgi:hypothetical protein
MILTSKNYLVDEDLDQESLFVQNSNMDFRLSTSPWVKFVSLCENSQNTA